jgi:UDP-glucose 4-epimerase
MAPAPISPYGLQKLAGETYCGVFHRLYGLKTVALRYFNVFGPRQDPTSEYSAVIPLFVTAIKSGRAPTIFGDGEQTRDFSYIENVVQANLRSCDAGPAAHGGAFNIACGERISLNDLVGILGGFAGREVAPVYAPHRPGDIKHSLAGIEKAQALLGYMPRVSLREGLKRTWDSL